MADRRPAFHAAAPTAMVWAALVCVYVLWGSTYLGIRVAVQTMPPFLMAGTRFLIAGAALFAWRFPVALRAGNVPTAAQWRRATAIGAALLLIGNGGVAWAEQAVPSGVTALLVAMVPLWMALIDRVWNGVRLAPRGLVGLVIGFGGVALLVMSPVGEPIDPAGTAVLALASFSWAAGSLYSRIAKMPDDSLLTTGMEMLTGGALLCVLGLITGEAGRVHLAEISTASWVAFVYLIIFGGIVGFGAYLWVIRVAPTALVSTYAYVNPIVAVALGWAILHESFGARTIAAAAIIVSAVALIVSAQASRRS